MDNTTVIKVQECIDRLSFVREEILIEMSKKHSVSKDSLCKTCKKSNICNPHNNYKVEATTCSKYIVRAK